MAFPLGSCALDPQPSPNDHWKPHSLLLHGPLVFLELRRLNPCGKTRSGTPPRHPPPPTCRPDLCLSVWWGRAPANRPSGTIAKFFLTSCSSKRGAPDHNWADNKAAWTMNRNFLSQFGRLQAAANQD